MKVKQKNVCDFCKKEYDDSKDAMQCEATCQGLTSEEYQKYLSLLEEEKEAFGVVAITSNEDTRKRCDDVIKAVIAFQREHNIVKINERFV